ncbi:MAG: phosphoribosylformylglycinamidine synthase I [Elusimicrobia bacterium RIFOXYD2_FULL_34_15]|nr:MAG: phosphoribosylformylglycinamidine synthase I [Elusimicrobia bacterium RIFOXYD2_FULL_34_15]
MNKTKVIVLRTAGTNCDIETANGFKLAGADPEIVHINKFLRNEKSFSDYKILAVPGGFSYGDDISAGKVFANKLKYKLKNEIMEFTKNGKLIIGICNGFQILVKSGFFPFIENKQSVTLTNNDSGKFECRWVYLKTMKGIANKIWTKGLPDVIQLPIAHGEGKFVCEKDTLKKIKQNSQIVFKYVDEKGKSSGFPYNPNGSVEDIVGITNPEGNIFGLMPHPERFVVKQQYPLWTKDKNVEPFGLMILKNAVDYAKSNL